MGFRAEQAHSNVFTTTKLYFSMDNLGKVHASFFETKKSSTSHPRPVGLFATLCYDLLGYPMSLNRVIYHKRVALLLGLQALVSMPVLSLMYY